PAFFPVAPTASRAGSPAPTRPAGRKCREAAEAALSRRAQLRTPGPPRTIGSASQTAHGRNANSNGELGTSPTTLTRLTRSYFALGGSFASTGPSCRDYLSPPGVPVTAGVGVEPAALAAGAVLVTVLVGVAIAV